MAEKYEFDFKMFEMSSLNSYTLPEVVRCAEDYQKSGATYASHIVNDMLAQYKTKNTLSDSQRNYLLSIIRYQTPEYLKYEQDFFSWFDSRPDIQEIYKFGLSSGYAYVQDPLTAEYVSKGSEHWNKDWETRPANSRMFWRVTNDWNVRKFKEINRDTVFEEGDLIVLRKPNVGNWRYDPYYDGRNTPDKLTERIGTVMQMTDDVHRRSRAGKGSRQINVLWIGQSEIKGVPERILKLHERKPRKKKA